MSLTRHRRASTTTPPPIRALPFDAATWHAIVSELKLSPMLAQTAELLLRGLEGKEIATHLGIGLPTVRTYLNRIYVRARERDRVGFILKVFAMVTNRASEAPSCHRNE
ncbi:MAG: hypothetical protein SFY96_12555 [Planctomycetota bacterium]|nr:hypothetical protein [Planctomycetota bacterium]